MQLFLKYMIIVMIVSQNTYAFEDIDLESLQWQLNLENSYSGRVDY